MTAPRSNCRVPAPQARQRRPSKAVPSIVAFLGGAALSSSGLLMPMPFPRGIFQPEPAMPPPESRKNAAGVQITSALPFRETGETSAVSTAAILLSRVKGLWPCIKGKAKLWLKESFASGRLDICNPKFVEVLIPLSPSSAHAKTAEKIKIAAKSLNSLISPPDSFNIHRDKLMFLRWKELL